MENEMNKEYTVMKETHKYVGIGTVVGLLVGQLLVAVTHWNNKEYLGVLIAMFIGMVIGIIKDQAVNRQLREKAYTVSEIQYQESTGKYEVLISSKTGEDVNLLIPAAKMDKEKLKVDDAVFLGKSKKSEQNGNG